MTGIEIVDTSSLKIYKEAKEVYNSKE